MNTQHPDLFPETLLVSCEGGRIYTTSLKVAEHFSKRHTDVLRAIENLVGERLLKIEEPLNERNFALISEFNSVNFERLSYRDSRGRSKPMYQMTHDGFALLAMGFTGAEALIWKIEFLNAFRAQEQALTQLTARYAHALDVVRPNLRPVVEGTEQGLNRSAIAEPLGKSAASITYHRRQARRFGLLTN